MKHLFTQNSFRLLALLAVLCLGAGFFFMQRNMTAKAYISIYDDRFEPQSINVPAGTMLIFKNVGQELHWPASNFHPTHNLYPEGGGCIGSKFDACRGLEPGEAFTFVINETGSWSVHDHIFPGLTMVINVAQKELQTGNIEANSKDFRTLGYTDQTSIIKKLALDDPAQAWQFLKDAFTVDGQVIGNAHEFAHMIGNEIYSQKGLSGIAICDDEFAFGCFHGVTEQFLAEKGKSAVKEVQEQCLQIYPPSQTQNFTGCIHGMGHGLLAHEGFEINKALVDCDLLDNLFRNYCYDGVFMENSVAYGNKFSLEQPWSFCENLNESYWYNCARYMSPVFVSKVGSIAGAAGYCAKTNREVFYQTCYQNIGYQVSQRTKGDYEEIKNECFSITGSEGANGCIIGAAIETVFQKYTSWNNVSMELCALLTAENRKKCLSEVNITKELYRR